MKIKQLIRFDWAMKRLLINKANFDILEGFLSELLKEDIKIKHILDSESNKATDDDKHNRVDILVENSKEELVIIDKDNVSAKIIAKYAKLSEQQVNKIIEDYKKSL